MHMDTAQAWLNFPALDRGLRRELLKCSPAELEDRFAQHLVFGTGGLRGVLGAGTNRMNVYTVTRATRGLAAYLQDSGVPNSCAIGYDSRKMSREFANLVAALLAEAGLKVHLYKKLVPTPMLSFAVRHLHCGAGIMITASHNPARFNGYKVYGPDGGQITLEAANAIEARIDLEEMLIEGFPSFAEHLAAGRICHVKDETIEAYYRSVLALRVAHSTQSGIRVAYSPLNGAGNLPVREILRRMGNVQVFVVKRQEMPNGKFPSCPSPNPEEPEAMKLVSKLALKKNADLCLATDPDGDRVGVGVRNGNRIERLSGNETGILLLEYLCREKRSTLPGGLAPVVVKTVVTTDMAEPICDQYGVDLRNVLTGFKFIGEQIGLLDDEEQKDRFLLGFEESYGYLSGTEVRDKDAVNAAMLICDMAVFYKAQGENLLQALERLYKECGYYLHRLLDFKFEGVAGMRQMNNVMAAFRAEGLASVGSLPVMSRLDYLQPDQANTGLPKSDMIMLSFGDKGKVVARPSGTEAKLKLYLSALSGLRAESERRLEEMARELRGFVEDKKSVES